MGITMITKVLTMEEEIELIRKDERAEGEKKAEEKAIRIAQNFLAMGIAVEAVAKATELPVEKILELQKLPQH
jgi:hypothetical protein